jgi:formate hydrogenlyase subunit 3/multisubunit Na+/H+ antiporter MnhD subunit
MDSEAYSVDFLRHLRANPKKWFFGLVPIFVVGVLEERMYAWANAWLDKGGPCMIAWLWDLLGVVIARPWASVGVFSAVYCLAVTGHAQVSVWVDRRRRAKELLAVTLAATTDLKNRIEQATRDLKNET